jgi:DNA-binding transcriptional LysR family regulator
MQTSFPSDCFFRAFMLRPEDVITCIEISNGALANAFCIFAEWAMTNWDNFRFVLAVARTGSALRAARVLGVDQTTVVRRITEMEGELGGKLFERRRSGFQITPLGERTATAAARLESEIMALESAWQAEQRVISGTVRFTCSDSFANLIMAPCLRQFRSDYPNIVVGLIADDRCLDLARGEADVALRAGARPAGAGIIARRMPDTAWSTYCSRAYASEHGHPDTALALDGHLVVGMEGAMDDLPAPRWLARMTPSSPIAARSNSLSNLVSALKAGLGVAMLPCFVGDAEADLKRCLLPIAELNSETWLILSENLRHTPHVRALADFVAAYVNSRRSRFAGASRA